MRACAETGDWIIDGDTIWLRPVPNLCVRAPVALVHVFGSLHAHPGRRDPQAHLRYWSLEYYRPPGEPSHCVTPWAFHKCAEVMDEWVQQATEILGIGATQPLNTLYQN
eukprot:8088043-Lingulodinium_polyedra.AAC.1